MLVRTLGALERRWAASSLFQQRPAMRGGRGAAKNRPAIRVRQVHVVFAPIGGRLVILLGPHHWSPFINARCFGRGLHHVEDVAGGIRPDVFIGSPPHFGGRCWRVIPPRGLQSRLVEAGPVEVGIGDCVQLNPWATMCSSATTTVVHYTDTDVCK